MNTGFLGPAVATVLTVYGIETKDKCIEIADEKAVATVLTVYGIETNNPTGSADLTTLQQYLPFTVLKLTCCSQYAITSSSGCNSTYRLRY